MSTACNINRRQVLGLGASMVGVTFLPSPGRSAPVGGLEDLTVFRTAFAPGDPLPGMDGLTVVPLAGARKGFAAMGEISEPKSSRKLTVPLPNMANRILTLTVRLRSDHGSGCAVWLAPSGGKRRRLGGVKSVSKDWKNIQFRFKSDVNNNVIEIVTPSSWGAPVGKVWVDEIILTAAPAADLSYAPGAAEDFPALDADGQGAVWMTSLVRNKRTRKIGIWKVEQGNRHLVSMLDENGRTGIDRPAICGTSAGCLVVYAVEQNDMWQLQPVWIDGVSGKVVKGALISTPDAAVNMSPSVDWRAGRATLVWESNPGSYRSIWSCSLTNSGNTPPKQISSPGVNSSNPDVVFSSSNEAFAVWNSFRERSGDLYGAWCRQDQWLPEQRLTNSPLIERYPRLAAHNGTVWLAWQALGFEDYQLNNLTAQRVAVAQLSPDGLHMPEGLFEKVSLKDDLLLRPVPSFDPEGRLWLTVRKSLGTHKGWLPQAWCCSGSQWFGPVDLWPEQGRWRPVTMAWDAQGQGVCAIQRDDLPQNWVQQGKRPDWQYDARPVAARLGKLPPAVPPKLVPLQIPAGTFSSAEYMESRASFLPRQKATVADGQLSLFWGDFHEHSDISVCRRSLNPSVHDVYTNLRELDRLDFAAVTDHGYNLDHPQWAYNGEQTRLHHDPKQFVTFLAEEWTSSHWEYNLPRPYRKYGHRNHIFLDPHYDHFYDAWDGDITPHQVWKQMQGTEFIAIPHQLADTGNCPVDWQEVDEKLQPVAEICQHRGSYEFLGCPRQATRGMQQKGFYLQDAWEQGVIIGVIASPDHGGGYGKIGVWAPELSREAIFQAIRARHTFGTSGAKIGLLFQQGKNLMGDKVDRRPDHPVFHVRANALKPIREIVIFRNNRIIHRAEPAATEAEFDWTDSSSIDDSPCWYYVRVHCTDDELAWSSPIWFMA